MTLNKRLYNLYIQSYDWNTRKKEYINSLRSSLCELCNINKGEDVHHQNYDSMDYDNPGDELDQHLIYVCKECHDYIHTLATGTHSTKQEDMNEGLRLLERINIDKRVKFEEDKKKKEEEYTKKQEIEKKKQEEEKIKKEETLKIQEEYRKKREIEKLEREKLEREERNMEFIKNIFFIIYIIISFIIYNNYIFPIIKNILYKIYILNDAFSFFIGLLIGIPNNIFGDNGFLIFSFIFFLIGITLFIGFFLENNK